MQPPPSIRENIVKGMPTTVSWYRWFSTLLPLKTFTGTITTAKLTTGGANGSMTFVSGVLVSQVAAT